MADLLDDQQWRPDDHVPDELDSLDPEPGQSVAGFVGGHNVQVHGPVNAPIIVGANFIANLPELPARDPLATPLSLVGRSRYWATVQKVASRCPSPVGREVEFAQIADFLIGEQPYMWWIGEPFSGKTTLAAALATDPPANVLVAAFFISRADGSRLPEFRAALADQLAVLAGKPRSWQTTPHGFEVDDLWRLAAARVRAAGHTLLLVVDGLDEDRNERGVSIASQLPESFPDGSRVLVTSRNSPDVLASVGERHPLRTSCVSMRLRATEGSIESRDAMLQELRRSLDDSDRDTARLNRSLLGLLVAADGHLTADDLVGLSPVETDRFEATQTLEQTFGRLVEPRDEFGERRYVLAHDIIRDQTVATLGDTVQSAHRERVGEWAAGFADKGWPDSTPMYLLNHYSRLLADEGDVDTLLALQNPVRHRLQYVRSGGNQLTLRDLGETVDLVAARGADFTTLLRLALWADHIRHVTANLPPEVPGVWALLGRFDKAEHLARRLGTESDRVRAFAAIATAAADAGQAHYAQSLLEDAELAAAGMVEPDQRMAAFVVVAQALGATRDTTRARLVLDQAMARDELLPRTDLRDEGLVAVAVAAATIGYADLAVQALADMRGTRHGDAWKKAAGAALARGDLDAAEHIAASRTKSSAKRLISLLRIAVATGNRDAAAGIVDRAGVGQSVSREVAVLAARAGVLDRAEQLARPGNTNRTSLNTRRASVVKAVAEGAVHLRIADAAFAAAEREYAVRALRIASSVPGKLPAWAILAGRALAAFDTGDDTRGADLLGKATSLVAMTDSLGEQMATLAGNLLVANDDGDDDRVSSILAAAVSAARRSVGHVRDTTLVKIAVMAATIGLLSEAEEIATSITGPEAESAARARVAAVSDLAVAERLTLAIPNPHARTAALHDLALAAAAAGAFAKAEEIAQRILFGPLRQVTLMAAADHAIAANALDAAERLVTSGNVVRPYRQATGLAQIARAAHAAEDMTRAERLLARAEQLIGDTQRAEPLATPLARVVAAAESAGLHADSEAVAALMTDPAARGRSIAQLVDQTTHVSDHVRNRRLMEAAERAVPEVTDPASKAALLTHLADAALRIADDDRVGSLTDKIVQVARDEVTEFRQQVRMYLTAARLAIRAGDQAKASRLVNTARQAALSAPSSDQSRALAYACRQAVGNGQFDEAERLARAIPRATWSTAMLTTIAIASWWAKDHRRAKALIKDAEQASTKIASRTGRAVELARVARAAALAHDRRSAKRMLREAEQLTDGLPTVESRFDSLLGGIQAYAALGDTASAGRLTEAAVVAVDAMPDRLVANRLAGELVKAAALAGRIDDAERIALAMAKPYPKYALLTGVATMVADDGDRDRVELLCAEAVKAAEAIANRKARNGAVCQVIGSIARMGHYQTAEAAARVCSAPSRALTTVACALARDKRFDEAERVLETIPNARHRAVVLSDIARAAAAAADRPRAEQSLLRAFRDDAETVPVDLIITLYPAAAKTLVSTLSEIRDYSIPRISVPSDGNSPAGR
ncbi:hypothetical protein [Actinokineospora terrae]|uniref:hypothetical protein n=1 Tax=Actinokineospora terrae TaxID=155974 RepID=UPI000B872E95|nr:hypothetical protein [Actinokineospora terrae]